MRKRSTQLLFICFFQLFCLHNLRAQEFEWAKGLGLSLSDGGGATLVKPDKNGNVYVYSPFKSTITLGDYILQANTDTHDDAFLAKYGPDGKVLWAKHIHTKNPNQENKWLGSGRLLQIDQEGNCILIGPSYFSIWQGVTVVDGVVYEHEKEGSKNYLITIDPSGKLLSHKDFTVTYPELSIRLYADVSGNIYVSGFCEFGCEFEGKGFGMDSDQSFIAKYSKRGDFIWFKVGGGERAPSIVVDPVGNVYATGSFKNWVQIGDQILRSNWPSETMLSEGYIYKLDVNGAIQWITHTNQRNERVAVGNGIYIDQKGKIGINSVEYSNTLATTVIAKYDPLGKLIEAERSVEGILIADNAEHIYSYQERPDEVMVIKADYQGNTKWKSTISGVETWDSYKRAEIVAGSKKDIYIRGFLSKTAVFNKDTLEGIDKVFIAKLVDTTYVPVRPHNNISGKIFQDIDGDCKQTSADIPWPNQIVKADPGAYYTFSDSAGSYTFLLDKGTYTISQLFPPNKKVGYLQKTCPASNTYSVTFNSYGKDTTGFDFGNQVTKTSFLKVDVAANRRTRCFRSTTTVKYCNDGFLAAKDVQVQVAYPQYVVPISADVPWNRKDSLLTFAIGTLAPGACGTITIVDSVICGNQQILGLTQCVKATITPKNATSADSRWDKSDLELKAVCKDNGFVRLTILNSGQGNMADSAAYRVYLDAEQVFAAQYQLASGDSLVLEVPVNGKTIRLEADLRPFNPQAERQPSVTLEGCGSANSVSISKGFVTQLPQDDAPEEVSTACLEIRGSMDPNDKQVIPKGVGSNNIVAKGQELEYLIRFQNTGTDVAYTVSIQDTLDENLNIASLQIGAASHPFAWAVSGQGRPVLTWTFKNINLPDSNSNESESHGFVRFCIGQNEDLALGTPIHNQAAIYFDYNSPVLTNITTNTVDELPQNNDIKPSVQACGSLPSQAQAGGDVVINETSHSQLNAIAPVKGFGRWRLISGKAAIADVENHASAITELGVGKNIFVWTVKLCDKESNDSVTIERVVIPPYPAAQSPAPVCFGESLTTLTATGTNVKWYSDKALTKKIGEGNQFQPLAAGGVYVTQTVDGYESKATELAVVVKAAVPMPKADSIGYTCNGLLTQDMEAIGENLAWYADEAQTQLIATGAVFTADKALPDFLYVTQTIDGCESKAWKIPVVPGATDLTKKKLIPNVISPNGDGKNDSFRQPEFPENLCIGNFVRIHIYSRWGKLVFSSTDPAFAWMAQDLPNGLYQYEMQYSNIVYRGGLTVL